MCLCCTVQKDVLKNIPQLFCGLLKVWFFFSFFSVKCCNCGPVVCCSSIPANSLETGDLLLLASDKSSAVHSSPGIPRFRLCLSRGHTHWCCWGERHSPSCDCSLAVQGASMTRASARCKHGGLGRGWPPSE